MVLFIVAAAVGVLALAIPYALDRLIIRSGQCFAPGRTDNGVRVGAPKVYDNRALALMLEKLEGQLREIQNIDGSPLNSAVGSTQGTRSSDVSATVGVDLITMPGTKPGVSGSAKGEPGTPDPASSGERVAGNTPPTSTTPFKWSERAADLLDDQINLSYQIFNLRLLLERAISDRLTPDFKPRLQAVVALPISIDTPAFAIGCSAVVEVRFSIDVPEGSPDADRLESRISLVALFPQEETYNTLSVDHRSARGTGRVAYGALNASGSASRSSNASYIRRQADIVAVEREPTNADRSANRGEPLIVSWEFRPGAGEPSVKSGLRQVLAVLALPQVHAKYPGTVKVNVDVRSLWRRWNSRTSTTADRAGWRPLFTNRIVRYDFGRHRHVSVPLVGTLDDYLAPKITSITWYRVGPQQACVTVKGSNFFTGTTAIMGGTTVTAKEDKDAGGLTIKSEETLQLIVPLKALLHDALLNGRYGESLAMQQTPKNLPPVLISGVWLEPKPGNQSYEAVIDFQSRTGESLNWDVFSRLPTPIFALNDTVIESGLLFDPPAAPASSFSRITARAIVNASSLGMSLLIAVRWPFCGPAWSLRFQLYNSSPPITVLRTDCGQDVVLLLCGPEFDDSVKVILGESHAVSDNGSLTWASPDVFDVLQLKLRRQDVLGHQTLLVLRAGRATVQVPIPPAVNTGAASIDSQGTSIAGTTPTAGTSSAGIPTPGIPTPRTPT